MKSFFFKLLLLVCVLALPFALAQSEETQGEEGHHDHEEHKHDHDESKPDEHKHDEHDEQGDHDEEESTGGVGPGNAVTAADEHDGIKLSDKAQKAIGLKTDVFGGGEIVKSALVFHQDNISVYRFKDGWFKLIPATELQAGDQVVVSGTALLRVAELDAFSTETGHSH